MALTDSTSKPTFVYLIEAATGYVKIGVSHDPQERLAGLQTSNPDKLTLRYTLECPTRDAARRVEGMLHDRYKAQRQNGEWFSVPAETVVFDIVWALSLAREVRGALEYVQETITETKVIYREVKPYRWAIWLRRLFKRPTDVRISRETPRTDLAMQWLQNNPEYRNQTGRWLRDNIQPEGITISHVTWDKAKRILQRGHK